MNILYIHRVLCKTVVLILVTQPVNSFLINSVAEYGQTRNIRFIVLDAVVDHPFLPAGAARHDRYSECTGIYLLW